MLGTLEELMSCPHLVPLSNIISSNLGQAYEGDFRNPQITDEIMEAVRLISQNHKN